MYQIFLLKKTNQFFAVKQKHEIVDKMRQREWQGRSTNSDYMYVFAFKNNLGFSAIRLHNEEEFIEDLMRYNFIKQLDFISFFKWFIVRK